MVNKYIISAYFFFLFVLSKGIIAQDSSSGSISVEVRQLDSAMSVFVWFVVCLIAVISAVLSIILVIRRINSNKRVKKQVVFDIRTETVRKDAVVSKQESRIKLPSYFPVVDFIDEKSNNSDDSIKKKSEIFRSSKKGVIVKSKVKSELVSCSDPRIKNKSIANYLKEDEKIVINVLRLKNNSCSQATIRVVTDFSKARLSRIITELELRGIIFKKEDGRKNIITLNPDFE